MASIVEICSNALMLLGEAAITSIDTPANDRERLCAAFWPVSRDAVLRAHAWGFATTRQALVAVGTVPINGYGAQYTLPTTPYCLRVLELNDDPLAEWVVEGRYLLTDESTAIIKYVARVTESGNYDSLFVEALTAYLAMNLSPGIVKGNGGMVIMGKLSELYKFKIMEARGINRGERGIIPDPVNDLASVR